MSTKAIRAVLAAFKKQCEADQHGISAAEALRHAEALAEVEAIEKAACDMSDNGSDGADVSTFELFDVIAEQAPRRKVAPPSESA